MYGSSIGTAPAAGISGFAPFADTPPPGASTAPDAAASAGQPLLRNAAASFADNIGAPTVAGTAGTAALDACALRPQEAVGSAQGKRDASTVKFTMEHVVGPMEELLKNDQMRRQLDNVVDTAKGMDITEIEIKGYFPFFSEFAKMHAQAVKNFLVYRGVDANVIRIVARGPGLGSKHAPLAKARAVVVEITGTPKQTPHVIAAAQPATRSGGYLIA